MFVAISRYFSRAAFIAGCLLAAFLLSSTVSLAQPSGLIAAPSAAPPAFALPTDAASWINSAPLTLASLEGKAAVLYFYEEGCPRCREKWPALLATANKFAGKPVVFIAVNSGNPRATVQQYAQQNNINWPVIVDSNRQLEQAAGVGTISLQNITQVAVVSPKGQVSMGSWDDVEGTAAKALVGAAWKVDPAGMPAALKPAWQAVELGNYAAAGASVKRSLLAKDAATKEAAEKLMAAVQTKIDADMAAAKTFFDSGDKYAALRRYNELAARFAGFDLPPEVAEQRKTLAADPQVKAGLVAAKNLETAQKAIAAGGTPSTKKRVEGILQNVVKEVPGTELATQAEELLKQLGAK